jgi:predicted transcriptional regulator
MRARSIRALGLPNIEHYENKLTVNQATGYIYATEGVISMSTINVKEEAKRLIEKLPENMTWDDLMHEIYVRQSIEVGLADSEAGKVTDVAEVRAKFELQS